MSETPSIGVVQPDWETARFQYEFTAITLKALARKLGVPLSRVKSKAHRDNWQKKVTLPKASTRITDDEREKLKEICGKAITVAPDSPLAAAGLLAQLTFEELRDKIVAIHLSDASNIRDHLRALLADAVAFRTELDSESGRLCDITERAQLVRMNGQTLRDLVIALQSLVEIERTSLGLDHAPIDPHKSYEDFLRMSQEMPDGTTQTVEIGRRTN